MDRRLPYDAANETTSLLYRIVWHLGSVVCLYPLSDHAVTTLMLPCQLRGSARAATPSASRSRRTLSIVANSRKRREAEEAAQQRTFRALDGAVRMLNGLLAATDMFGTVGSKPPALLESGAPAQLARAAGASKWVRFHCRAKTVRDVAQARAPGRLDAYLSLPAEQYSLLDPNWVTRLDDSTFRFSVPLGAVLEELMQGAAAAPAGLARMVPAITVRTRLDGAAQRVTLSGEEASLGTRELDEHFSLTFTTSMTWGGGPPLGWTPPPTRYVAVSGESALELVADENDVEATPPWELRCAVEVSGELLVPPPLAGLPRAVLGGAGSLLAKAVAQTLVPRFADMLAADYARWAAGSSREGAVGSFAQVAQAATTAEELKPSGALE